MNRSANNNALNLRWCINKPYYSLARFDSLIFVCAAVLLFLLLDWRWEYFFFLLAQFMFFFCWMTLGSFLPFSYVALSATQWWLNLKRKPLMTKLCKSFSGATEDLPKHTRKTAKENKKLKYMTGNKIQFLCLFSLVGKPNLLYPLSLLPNQSEKKKPKVSSTFSRSFRVHYIHNESTMLDSQLIIMNEWVKKRFLS